MRRGGSARCNSSSKPIEDTFDYTSRPPATYGRRGKIPTATGPGAETQKIGAPMAGVGAMFTGPRVAGAEDDGFRARSTSAVPRSATLQQSGCRVRTTVSRLWSSLSVAEIPFSYGPGSTGGGGIVAGFPTGVRALAHDRDATTRPAAVSRVGCGRGANAVRRLSDSHGLCQQLFRGAVLGPHYATGVIHATLALRQKPLRRHVNDPRPPALRKKPPTALID